MRSDIIFSLEMKIINLIPDALFIALHDDLFHPMRAAVVDAIAALCIDKRILLGIAERNSDLSNLSPFRQMEDRLLIIRFHRLDPTGVRIPIIYLIPRAVVRVSLLTILLYIGNLYYLIRAEMMDLIGVEGRGIIQRNTAPSDPSL